MAAAPPAGTLAASPAPTPGLPALFDRGAIAALGLDPDYVRRLVYVIVNDDGSETVHALERWAGPLVFCVEGGVDRDLVARVADEVHRVTGLPASMGDVGCNVRWTGSPGRGHQATGREVVSGTILSAHVYCYLGSPLGMREALHEAGHVIGLGHSPRPYDLMNAGPRVDDFSADELAVLAWMYGRR